MRLKKAAPSAPPLITHCVAVVPALAFCLTIGLVTPVAAGPVERELKARGGDVGFPKQRPTRATINSAPEAALPNPLDRSRDGKIRRRPRTDATAQNTSQSIQQTDDTPVEPTATAQSEPSACFQALLQIAEARQVPTPEAKDSACVIEDPVVMTQTRATFPVQFNNKLTLDCPFALALAKFSSGTTQPLARHHLGTAIEKIHSGEGFVCRRRNNSLTGKLSEHAFGNATDWVGFTFVDGSRLAIKSTDEMAEDEAAFLDSVRTAACGTFTTVLGPGSNAAHSSHFHFDLGRSKGRKNPYRICE